MKSLIVALSLAVASAGFLAPTTADAKRLGGGSSLGMQRSLPARTPTPSPPARPAQVAPTPATAGAAAAAAPRRSWLGPLAGVAAGLGIAALMSHLGLGAGMGDFLSLLLMAVVAFVAIRFLMRRFGPAAPAMATPNGMRFDGAAPHAAPAAGGWTGASAASPALAAPTAAPTLPAGFDVAGFERIAKMIFIRMQTANDRADLNDLRTFTTPEMFASVRLELQERGSASQQTDVVRVDAQVLDVVTEAGRQIVSVRFHGLIREELNAPTATFDEVWHLVRPVDGSQEWAIAGIQQANPAMA